MKSTQSEISNPVTDRAHDCGALSRSPCCHSRNQRCGKGYTGRIWSHSDAAVLDVLFGKANPQGKLPFELPSSMEAVRNQKADVPYDSENPLYGFGHGLSY